MDMTLGRNAVLGAGAWFAVAASLAASEGTVAASDPAQVAGAMEAAGYVAQLDTDGYGDPLIRTTFAGYAGSIYFYGCDEANHTGCDSIQFRVGLDRKAPVTPELMNQIVRKYRFIALWLDKEGDPWVNHDVYIGSGVPAANFIAALKAFEGNFAAVADDVFAEERAEADATGTGAR
ncbi:YbjN domain-containing protein [Tsuneonella sp. YG55]|uniref:YbjN domain-containing protein n=1 Tax=Tsuneonella litorea TaxID=2976475 RepID=A0A9X2W1J0_9SPHN|nr:YbjN domain-containing protein [Tsuneonella litorea]MCT2558839.1 YbjN domain-containing protein [Tsuneonella litorea]